MKAETRYQIIGDLIFRLYRLAVKLKGLDDNDKNLLYEMFNDYIDMVDGISTDEDTLNILPLRLRIIFYAYFVNLMSDEDTLKLFYANIYYTLKQLNVPIFYLVMNDAKTTSETKTFKIFGIPIEKDKSVEYYFDTRNIDGKTVKVILVDNDSNPNMDFSTVYAIFVEIVTNSLTVEEYEVPASNTEVAE